jgi:hypothetical protein
MRTSKLKHPHFLTKKKHKDFEKENRLKKDRGFVGEKIPKPYPISLKNQRLNMLFF